LMRRYWCAAQLKKFLKVKPRIDGATLPTLAVRIFGCKNH